MNTLALALLVALQAEASKPLPLQVPDGWESATQDGVLIFSPKGTPEGKLFKVLIPPLTRKVGSLDGLLDAGKTTLGEIATFTPLRDAIKGKTDGEWEYQFAIGTLEKEGQKLVGQAWGFRKAAEEGLVLVIADSLETVEKYSEAFGAMVKSLGVPKAAPAATKVDLTYTVPAGWERKDQGDSVLLEKWLNKGETFYHTERQFRLLILPSQPLAGTLKKAFLETWTIQIKGSVDSAILPLPMMRRLKSGMAVAYDVDADAKNKKGVPLVSGLYVLARGTRMVPVIAFHSGFDDVLTKDLLELLESAEIPGAGDGRVALFAAAELAGEWATSSMVLANYVTSSGAYAGDATVATSETITLNADQTFKTWFMGLSGTTRIRESNQGKWSIDDATLVLNGEKDKERRYLIYGVGSDAKLGHFLVKNDYSSSETPLDISRPRRPLSAAWLKKKE